MFNKFPGSAVFDVPARNASPVGRSNQNEHLKPQQEWHLPGCPYEFADLRLRLGFMFHISQNGTSVFSKSLRRNRHMRHSMKHSNGEPNLPSTNLWERCSHHVHIHFAHVRPPACSAIDQQNGRSSRLHLILGYRSETPAV